MLKTPRNTTWLENGPEFCTRPPPNFLTAVERTAYDADRTHARKRLSPLETAATHNKLRTTKHSLTRVDRQTKRRRPKASGRARATRAKGQQPSHRTIPPDNKELLN
jgi:hypothetical protein